MLTNRGWMFQASRDTGSQMRKSLTRGGLAALIVFQVACREPVPVVLPAERPSVASNGVIQLDDDLIDPDAAVTKPEEGLTDPEDSVTNPDWGHPVDGLSYRLRADRLTWQSWQQPLIWLDVRNDSENLIPGAELQKSLSLQWDSKGPQVIQQYPPMDVRSFGKLYAEGRLREGEASFTDLAPGESLSLPVAIGSDNRSVDKGLGTDAIQVGLGKETQRTGTRWGVSEYDFYSNLLPLQILPPGVRNSQEFEVCLKRCDPGGQPIDAGFVPTRMKLVEGQPLLVTFVVRNPGQQEFKYDTGGDYRENNRHDRFKIAIHDDHGDLLPDPRPTYARIGGGLLGGVDVAPGRLSAETVELARYRTISKPGRYTVTVRFDLTNRTLRALHGDAALFAVRVETTYRVTVLPRTPENVERTLAPLFARCDRTAGRPLQITIDEICQLGGQAARPGLERLAQADSEALRQAALHGLEMLVVAEE